MPNYGPNVFIRQPKLMQHCIRLYELFERESADGIWRGRLVASARKVGIPNGVYKRVVTHLQNMQCIEQLDRGDRSRPTSILLLAPPTVESWRDESEAPDLTPELRPAILSRRIDDLEKRIGGLDIVQAFKDLQQQVYQLQQLLNNKES